MISKIEHQNQKEENTDKLYFAKITTLQASNDTIKKVKRELKNGRKNVHIIYLISDFNSEYMKTT